VRRTTAVALLPLLVVAACGSGGEPADGSVAVSAGDSSCEVARTSLPAGTHTLAVTNTGKDTTEVYVYAAGDRVVGEVENIAPGTGRDLVVQLAAGSYAVACKPGQTGRGIRTPLTVTATATASAGAAATDLRLAAAVRDYTAWVQSEVAALVPATEAFAAAVVAGDTARAKALYAASRIGWERIEPVAESFGDLDPKVDAREADLEPGQAWTGWHQLEKALWTTGKADPAIARRLVADVRDLQSRVRTVELTPAQLGNGAKELLDEVATGKVTGEEEAFSHTDLVDFQANVEGAKKAYDVLRAVVVDRDPTLATELDSRFAEVLTALAAHGSGARFTSYDRLTPAQVRSLAAKVDALSEPLSRLTATVVA
jgi:iron uptake system component EfeO